MEQQNSLHKWGDMGNGLYRNPVLNADYSDPDVVRVGRDFYMVCSEFHYMGIPVLHSQDLVNWKVIGKAYDRLEIAPQYSQMEAYGRGSWAPSITYHDGWFYLYFCTPSEGLFMTKTQNPAGPWEPLHCVYATEGWEDPCPFWDDDGSAYLGHSVLGAGPIIVHRMSPDGKSLLDNGKVVYVGKTAEGTKFYKSHGYYMLVIPEGGVGKGWQTVLRSKESVYGPFERKVVLETGKTNVNGPHQGSLIELDNGESWFIHFQDTGALGRVCHLQPVSWKDGWPVMGAHGEPVSVFQKPNTGINCPPSRPQTSDSFEGSSLGLQWAFNHNPVDEKVSLTEQPGALRMYSMEADCLLNARNTITQKLMGRKGQITVRISAAGMADGQRAGLAILGGRAENWIEVQKQNEKLFIETVAGGIAAHGAEIGNSLWFRCDVNLDSVTYFSFSTDGKGFMPLGGPCEMINGFWKGARPALYTFHTSSANAGGYVDWYDFTYEMLN